MQATTEEITDLLKRALELKSLDSRLWDTADVAAFLKLNVAHVRRHILTRADFPRPLDLPGTGTAPIRRFVGTEVVRWVNGEAARPRRRMSPRAKAARDTVSVHLRSALRQARKRATKHSRAINIAFDDVAAMLERQAGRCAVSGMPFSLEQTGGSLVRPFAPSLDRIDCARGYEIGNVRLVCHCINLMMNEWGDVVFARVSAAMRERPC